ncbi:phage integrase N-terminal SAM-like domain-containing protein, partial [Treponema sp. R8-4-B8]
MDVLYLFRESGNVRIPFTGYDPPLFRCFIANGGKWDDVCHSFIFIGDFDTEFFSNVFKEFLPKGHSTIPIVQIQENSSNQPQISGFFDHPLEYSHEQSTDITPLSYAPNNDEYTYYSPAMKEKHSEYSPTMKNKQTEYSPIIKKKQTEYPPKKADVLPASPFSFPVSPSLPEKLSNQLKEKLEAELRSRKYSVQTRRAYIYYNRLICRTLQKTPEEIRPDDITEFLALMEKDKKYSASAMNLAISAIKFLFKYILKDDSIEQKHRPRHDGRLPMILSKEEISKIFSLEKNPKHR